MHDFIPVNEPLLCGNEKKYINECIDTGWISSEGPFVKRFEEEMSSYVGRKYGIAVSNGTTALETAMQALNLKKGTEVILPAFTIMSCAQAIVKAGLIPVVVDCDKDTWNMDVNQIEDKITANTSAIMVVHIYGLTVDMDPVIALAAKYGLKLIEDAAEVHGQTYKGQACGSFGDISIFSFYANKNITCGEGGMIVTDEEQLAKRCKSIRNLCFEEEKRYIHKEIGSNFRMTNMQAALGVAQLEYLSDTIVRKCAIGEKYRSLLEDVKGLIHPLKKTDYCNNIYWVYGMVLEETLPVDALFVMNRLKEKKIGTRPFFYPIHKQPALLEMGYFKKDYCPNADMLSERGFYIPSGLGITEEKIEIVAECVRSILNEI